MHRIIGSKIFCTMGGILSKFSFKLFHKKSPNENSNHILNQSKKKNSFKKFKDRSQLKNNSLQPKQPQHRILKRKSILSRSKNDVQETKKLKLENDVICISSEDEEYQSFDNENEEGECSFNPASEAVNSTQRAPEIAKSTENENFPELEISGFYEDRNPGIDATFVPTYSAISSQEDFNDDSVVFVGRGDSEETEEGEIKDDDDTVILVDDITPQNVLSSEIIDLDLEKTLRPVSPALDFIPLPQFTEQRKKKRKQNKNNNYKEDNLNASNSNSSETKEDSPEENKKRMIVIDGSNVAWGYTNRKFFSVRGIEICINYFKSMGHEVTAVIPQFRMRKAMSTDQELLEKLENDGNITLTPCKNLPGKRTMSYDDRFILKIASGLDAVVISNDNYRDLIEESAKFKEIIEERVVGYTWIKDLFIIPDDPYGKNGPKLKDILNRK